MFETRATNICRRSAQLHSPISPALTHLNDGDAFCSIGRPVEFGRARQVRIIRIQTAPSLTLRAQVLLVQEVRRSAFVSRPLALQRHGVRLAFGATSPKTAQNGVFFLSSSKIQETRFASWTRSPRRRATDCMATPTAREKRRDSANPATRRLCVRLQNRYTAVDSEHVHH